MNDMNKEEIKKFKIQLEEVKELLLDVEIQLKSAEDMFEKMKDGSLKPEDLVSKKFFMDN